MALSRFAVALVCGLTISFLGPSDAHAQRRVEGTTINSDTLPAVRLQLDGNLTYVGTQTVMLSGGTRAEQHFFLQSDGGRIKRLYWVQFEGKPASGRPYDYSADPTINISGRPFHANYRHYPTRGFAGPAGSDGDQAQRFLERQGYRLGSDLARVRLVWLLDDPPFNELMIIYLEDLADHGLVVEDLRADPGLRDRWAARLANEAVDGTRLLPLDR